MATDFNKNQIAVSNTMLNKAENMPLDARTVIDDIADVESIPNPFVGMLFYSKSDKKTYYVKSLKTKEHFGIATPNALIDEYRVLSDPSIYSTNTDDYYKRQDQDAKIDALERELLNLESKIAGNENILQNIISENFSNLNNIIINEGYYDENLKHISF